MIPRAMDSLELVETVMLVEEIFETEIPDDRASSPCGIVDWLESRLLHQRPNKPAAALLRKLAKDQQQPELAEGLGGTWRGREQIAAIVKEIFR